MVKPTAANTLFGTLSRALRSRFPTQTQVWQIALLAALPEHDLRLNDIRTSICSGALTKFAIDYDIATDSIINFILCKNQTSNKILYVIAEVLVDIEPGPCVEVRRFFVVDDPTCVESSLVWTAIA